MTHFDKKKNPLTYQLEQGDITDEEFNKLLCDQLNDKWKAEGINKKAYVSAQNRGRGFEWVIRSVEV